jgi:hypothetical protein
METSQILPLGEGLELSSLEMSNGQLVLHVTATSLALPAPCVHNPQRAFIVVTAVW